MSLNEGIIIPVMFVTDILFLFCLVCFVPNLTSLRLRILVTVVATLIYVCTLSQLSGFIREATLAFMIVIVLPTLAVLTVFPFVGSHWEKRNQKKMISLFSLPLTIGIIYYLWAWSVSGVPTLFLPTESLIPSSSPIFLPMGQLILYCYLVIICGILVGAAVLAGGGSTGDDNNKQNPAIRNILITVLILGIGLLFCDSLVVGFLAIFLYLILCEIPIYPLKVAIPAIFAFVIVSITTLAVPPESFRFTLYALIILALGIVTPFPVFQHYFRSKEITVLYLGSTVTVMILTLFLFPNPDQNIFENLAQGLSAVTNSGAFAMGLPVNEGVAIKLILYGSTVALSATGFAIIALIITQIRKRNRSTPSITS